MCVLSVFIEKFREDQKDLHDTKEVWSLKKSGVVKTLCGGRAGHVQGQ